MRHVREGACDPADRMHGPAAAHAFDGTRSPVLVAVQFYEVVLALHIAAVVVAFGVTFAYPIIFAIIGRQDPRALGALHRAELAVSQRLIMPGLAVVILAGIYLASKLEVWSSFYVQWGLGAAIVLGGLGGMFFAPTARQAEPTLADRDVASAGDGELSMSAEYEALSKRLAIVGALWSLLVMAPIFTSWSPAPAPRNNLTGLVDSNCLFTGSAIP